MTYAPCNDPPRRMETGPGENPNISPTTRQFPSHFGIDDGFWSDALQMVWSGVLVNFLVPVGKDGTGQDNHIFILLGGSRQERGDNPLCRKDLVLAGG
ncbi:hypothetical protein AVEN_87086-1 [Araneus ventricosus]|uniref:Uncharacterized protein n=1 Tax=Araneus ventricosus TaxID=182803 RepID=A0A4Y2U1Q6_ARAVE|nr:hypothetical protein AVEN_87086-1 [Araneus ventricosus]